MKKIFGLSLAAVLHTLLFASDTTLLRHSTATAGLKLPSGFSAIKVADNLGSARHLVVTPKGDIFVKLSSPKKGKGILWLHDGNNDGIMDIKVGFGNYGGTGMALKNGYLYASSNTDIYRYKLNADMTIAADAQEQRIVTGLLERNEHESKSIILDNNGNIFTNIGAYSNSCQKDDRSPGSMGMQPCPILDSAGGIWEFKADKTNQTYGDGSRYATGLRNVVGLDWNSSTNTLFVMQHGRDQLHDIFPKMFTVQQSAELPSECMYELHKGSNCGWPYMYYNGDEHKKILAPEYGGDGKKTVSDYQDPVVAFPAHMAPDALLFYTGTMFPDKYKNGAFIAFHGSWNRAPEPQKGYFVAFVPFKNGKPSGDWEIFADNFSGKEVVKGPGDAEHRPCGLAQGPDGSLYVSDDAKGTIYKISYGK